MQLNKALFKSTSACLFRGCASFSGLHLQKQSEKHISSLTTRVEHCFLTGLPFVMASQYLQHVSLCCKCAVKLMNVRLSRLMFCLSAYIFLKENKQQSSVWLQKVLREATVNKAPHQRSLCFFRLSVNATRVRCQDTLQAQVIPTVIYVIHICSSFPSFINKIIPASASVPYVHKGVQVYLTSTFILKMSVNMGVSVLNDLKNVDTTRNACEFSFLKKVLFSVHTFWLLCLLSHQM